MQSNPYPNDPNAMPPMEELPPASPYQPAPLSHQNQHVPPPYQQGAPYMQPADQYATPPSMQAPENAAREQQRAHTCKYRVAKVMDYLQWVLFALEMLFLLRFCLMLVGADPTNPFAQALYNFTGFFLAPFEGIVPSTQLGTKGIAVIEWSTLVGMAVYALLFYLVRLLLHITISRPEEPIE